MKQLILTIDEREKAALLVIALVFAFLLGGLFKLQIINHETLAAQSENNRLRVIPLTPKRGIVFDREENRIIDSRPSYTVSVVPTEMVKGVTIDNLSELLELDTLQIRKRIIKNTVSYYQPAPVKRDVPFEKIAILEEQNSKFPGVIYQIDQVRCYPVGLGSEVFTGYVGEVSQGDLQSEKKENLRLGSMIGKEGIEKHYDQQLRGYEGTEYIEVSATGQILGTYDEKPEIQPTQGSDITLTIDLDLQQACSEVLDTFCCGAIVAADPRTGEILAMTSFPSYDANIFSSVIPESLWQAISNDSSHPLLNRPLKGLYPPGSTVKFVTVGAALEEGLINEFTTLQPCNGGYQFGNRFFHCWDRGGHGSLTAIHALERSCDVFMYQLGLKMGVDLLSKYFDLCGFGKKTGVDLPGEAPGLNPNSDYYNNRYGVKKWTKGLVLNLSIGQGELLVTPLHLVQFFCGLANHGIVHPPYMIKKITSADGKTTETKPQPSFNLPFSEKTMKVLLEGMRLVVQGEHGTAKGLRTKMYTQGGKTGTAQNPHGEDHSWYVGVAPLEDPEIVVCAIVENAGHGSEVAAPVVGEIIKRYMNNKRNKDSIVVIDSGEIQ
ncbi:MAG: penicillin-binding protein 2 [bacterium]